jgi:hypothetical protein
MLTTTFWLALCAAHSQTLAPASVGPDPTAAGEASSEDAGEGAAQDSEPGAPPSYEATLGAQWLWASGKAMPGVSLHVGRRWVWFDFETSLIALTEPAANDEIEFLGSQLGFYATLRPLYGERGELTAGLGSDVYALWNIHGDEWQGSFSVRVAGRVWLSRRIGLFATARAYPVASSGLELGVERDGSRGLPVLFGTGIEWRL